MTTRSNSTGSTRRAAIALAAALAFVLASGAAAAQADEPSEGHPLACIGTEPFWSLAIDGEDATFDTPDTPPTDWFASEWMPARGVPDRFMIRLGSGYGTGYLALFRQTCSDGMSDVSYPFEAILVTPGQAVRAGCCRREGAAPR